MNKTSQYIKCQIDSSESEDNDNYQKELMTNLIALTNKKSVSDYDSEKKPTDSRIEYVKNILEGCNLKPIINLDSYNNDMTKNYRLNKKIMDIKELILSMNIKLKYLKSGTTGHTFKAISRIDKNIVFAVKVCAYPRDDYGGINNMSRPENAEILMLKLLSDFVINKYTPHFVLPIYTFNTSITNFIKIPSHIINLNDEKNEMYRKFIERYHEGEFEDIVSVLISEWCNGGDLLDYIRHNYTSMALRDWKVIIFQILFTLALVHEKYPSFRHNDMKANNILVHHTNVKNDKSKNYYRYRLENVAFIIPNIGLQIKIWDFDFACIDGIVENNKVNSEWTRKINITKKKNQYYDMHYFFNTLISKRFFPQFYEGGAPKKIVDFVHRIIPKRFRNGGPDVNKKGRIQVDTEHTTPRKVIMYDELFENYRFDNSLFENNNLK
jgi:serine/threonine protein kinase